MSSTGRLGLVVATALLLLPAASSGTTGSGLYGVVKKGPITPVCRVDVPCDAPFSASFTVQQNARQVAQFRSDASGQFTVFLNPGPYIVVPSADAPIISPERQTKSVTVADSGALSVVAKLQVCDEDAVATGRLQRVGTRRRRQGTGHLSERVEEGLRRLPRLPHRLRDGFPALDAPEVPTQDRRPALAVEEVLVPDGVDHEPPKLHEVVAVVVHADETASRAEHARDLREPGVKICQVVQHPLAGDEVEFGVGEREPLDVRHLGVNAVVACLRDGRVRLVGANDLGCGISAAKSPLPKLASSTRFG